MPARIAGCLNERDATVIASHSSLSFPRLCQFALGSGHVAVHPSLLGEALGEAVAMLGHGAGASPSLAAGVALVRLPHAPVFPGLGQRRVRLLVVSGGKG